MCDSVVERVVVNESLLVIEVLDDKVLVPIVVDLLLDRCQLSEGVCVTNCVVLGEVLLV